MVGHHAGLVTADPQNAQFVGADREDSAAAQLTALLWATSLAKERVAVDGARHIAIRHRSSMAASQCLSTCASNQHKKLVAIASTVYVVLSLFARCDFVTIRKKTKDPWCALAGKVAAAACHASALRTTVVLPFASWTHRSVDAVRLQYLRHIPAAIAWAYPPVDNEGVLSANPPGGYWLGLSS